MLTWRRLAVLIRHLPAGSACARALGYGDWTTTDYLLADLWQTAAGSEDPHPRHPSIAVQRRSLVEQLKAQAERQKRHQQRG